jgi:hypothetical protein
LISMKFDNLFKHELLDIEFALLVT